jgi:hypothetical protein
MRASSNQLASGQNELRASDAERDQAIDKLRDRFAEGRLSHDTFLYRMDVALRAKYPSELSELFADLPPDQPGRRSPGGLLRDQLTRLSRLRLAVPGQRAGRTRLASDPQPLYLPRQENRRFSIGRAPLCDFTVGDISVSRWHARLHKQDDCWLLCDLGSTNGTRLNGWRVTSAVPIRPGDQITLGSVVFVVADDPEPTF